MTILFLDFFQSCPFFVCKFKPPHKFALFVYVGFFFLFLSFKLLCFSCVSCIFLLYFFIASPFCRTICFHFLSITYTIVTHLMLRKSHSSGKRVRKFCWISLKTNPKFLFRFIQISRFPPHDVDVVTYRSRSMIDILSLNVLFSQ